MFHDFSFCFIDACFSSDSQSLAVIPSKFPGHIFIIDLPLVNVSGSNKSKPKFYSGPSNMHESKSRMVISCESRKAGPLIILGPAKGYFGQVLKMTHIACNSNRDVQEPYHYVTWNDDGLGEYCLWKVFRPETERSKFEYYPRLCIPRMSERNWEVRPSQLLSIIYIPFSFIFFFFF